MSSLDKQADGVTNKEIQLLGSKQTQHTFYRHFSAKIYLVLQQQLFYSHLSRTTRVSQYQKKHSPTHHT